MAENVKRMLMEFHPLVENHQLMLSCLLNLRVPLALALFQVIGDVPLWWHTTGDLDACAGERAPHNWYIMLPISQRVQPGVYTTPSWLSAGIVMPSSGK